MRSSEILTSVSPYAAATLDAQGLLRVDGAISADTAAALLAEVNAALDMELGRAG